MNAWPREKWHCDNFELLLMNQSVIAKDDGLMARIDTSRICTLSMNSRSLTMIASIIALKVLT